MKIKKVEIFKFRSIENGSFHIDDILGIVGQNNSGKTAILRALNSFFNPQIEIQHYLSGVNLYSTNRAVPRITLTFINIPNKPVYTPFIINGELKIKQEFNKTRNRLEYSVLNNGVFESTSDIFISTLKEDVQFILIPTDRTSSFYSKKWKCCFERITRFVFFKSYSKKKHFNSKS